MSTTPDFVGSGWAFPVGVAPTGSVALVSGEDEIEQAIWIVLSTQPGERPMRPDFGCGIQDYVFANADATTAGRIAYEVRMALGRWEPRIDVIDVKVLVDADDRTVLYIDIGYRIRATNSTRNLVFPFYTIPGQE